MVSAFLEKRSVVLALLLGVAAACGFAPLDLWPLTIAAIAGWMLLVHRAPTMKAALWRGWAFGVGHFTINNNWFQHAFDFQDKMPPVLGYAAPLLLALYLAVYPALAAGAAWRVRRERIDAGYVLSFAAAWIVTEWLRSVMFTGYAWDPLGVIWVPVQPVATLAAWVGTYALSGLTVLLAGTLLLLPRRPAPIAAAVAVLAGLIGAQFLSYRTVDAPARAGVTRIRVVQPNVPQDARGESDGEMMLAKLSALSGKPGAAPRLIVWPEGVVRDYFEDGYPDYAYTADPFWIRWRMARLLGPRDMLLTGGTALQFDRAGNAISATNSVFAVDPRARIKARYDKAHLVPYGEYLPMPWLLKPFGLARLVPGSMDFVEGPGPRALDVPGIGAVGIQLCYEIIFSGEVIDPARRPRVLFNPSNDAWFGTWGPPQHLAQARMRAIEEGLPIIRATPNGISAVIAADGRLLATVPHEQAGAIEVPLPEALPPTFFSRVGNWLAGAVALLLAAAAIAIRRRRG
ncbi:apolipoprotein N-acyltransferase [Sphingomonas radiodurans]|uniref:apolipoprotein N-acyltransferase n=1 Tax=Sphingomonas radiodurans TaxID=2890321 RepID=UPI001E615602|nr:apolipoprotein N-acyltransferase [Sphingomonas radiodurans]WBH18369.1 apolipoprotein N-acyltransferase [Sphingomonas radiodurans]